MRLNIFVSDFELKQVEITSLGLITVFEVLFVLKLKIPLQFYF